MNDITKRTIGLISNTELKEKCCIEISKDNKFLIRMEKDHKLRYIGSKYSVEKDIEKFYKDILQEANAETIFIIFGLAAGEHIKYLFDRVTNKILIIEPSAAVIKKIVQENYINYILQDERIGLCYFDYGIRKNLKDFIEEHSIYNTKFITFSNYNSIFENEYKTTFSEYESIKGTKDDTFNVFSHKFFENFIENIFSLDEFYTVNRLKNLYICKPAVIVSAGPSLTKNIHLLKDVQDKFIIICGPRTIGALTKNGIKPDFLCLVDPQNEAYELMKDCMNLEVPLVFMDSSSNKTVKNHKGLKIIAANQGMENYLEEMLGIKVDSLMQGGSVAHFCMGLAVYMGCSNVIFIGQDLAYTNERFQAEGTYSESGIDELKYKYEKDKEKWNKDKNYSVYVPDIYGQMVRTSNVLNSYRQEFEDLIYSCNGVRFINSTEGGANIKGTKVMDLKDSIRICGEGTIDKNIGKLIGDKTILDEYVFIENMFKVIDKLEVIKKACDEGLEYSDKMLCFYKYNKYCDMNKVFNKLDKIDAIINDKKKLGFIAYKAVALINNILENDYYKEKANETEKELGIRLAKRSFGIYLSVLQAVEEAVFRIKDKFTKANTTKIIYDVKEKIDLNNLEVLYGDKKIEDGKVLICSEEIETTLGDIINQSNILITEKFSLKKDNVLCLKINADVKKNYTYLRFFSKQGLGLFKDLYNKKSVVDTNTYLDIYIGNNLIGYAMKEGNKTLFDHKIGNICSDNIEMIFDLNGKEILINNQKLFISQLIINKYINNRVFVILSGSTNRHRYELHSIEYGVKNNNVLTFK